MADETPPSDLARGLMPVDAPDVMGAPSAEGEPEVVVIEADGEGGDGVLGDDGILTIEHPSGDITVDFNPDLPSEDAEDASEHDANLVDFVAADEVSRIGSELLAAIQLDEESRREWLQTRARGYDMLGYKIEEPRGDVGASSAPLEGMSTVRHTLLSESVIRFQATAGAELYPATGPVKVRNDSPGVPPAAGPGAGDAGEDAPELAGLDNDDLAEALERALNHYLTDVDKGYRADSERMLFLVGFGGVGFKKVYHDPIRRMPLSRAVDAADLIVSNDAGAEIDDVLRVTHRILMRKSELVRMSLAGVYRNVDKLAAPVSHPTAIERKVAEVQGTRVDSDRPDDTPYTIYECYVELNVKGFEHRDTETKEQTGLYLPYRVTLDADSGVVLEIRRNWRADDDRCLRRRTFVKFPFVPAVGFYEIGLLQILGNATRALTAAWREMLDSGMFANFPGFLYSASAGGRQQTNEFRVPPGGGVPVNTGNKPIGDVVMRLPYNDVTPGLAALVNHIETTVQRLAGTSEILVGEGKQDMPVGTMLALLDQATKMLAAVHIRLHAAQAEEFQLLRELFLEDPEALWRNDRRPARKWQQAEVIAALERADIVPAADPNTPSHTHRIMKAVALKQLSAMSPQNYDARAVDQRIMRMIGIPDPQTVMTPPALAGAAPNPMEAEAHAKMAAVAVKAQATASAAQQRAQEQVASAAEHVRETQARAAEVAQQSADRTADRQSRERIAGLKEITERIKVLGSMAEKGQIPPEMAVAAILSAVGSNSPSAISHYPPPPQGRVF